MYDARSVELIKKDLLEAGVKELCTSQEVDTLMSLSGSKSVFINSVCGCAAGAAKPGFIAAMTRSSVVPQHIYTAFAGVDKVAVERMREHIVGYPPSSPCIAVFRDQQLVHMVERHDIEGYSAKLLEEHLCKVYEKFCGEQIKESVVVGKMEDAWSITPSLAKERFTTGSDVFIDCRSIEESQLGTIDNSLHLTQDLAEEIEKSWDKTKNMIIFCQTGRRSGQVVRYFRDLGFVNILNLKGGIEAWNSLLDSQ